MESDNIEALRQLYKQATDEWVAALRTEEALATPDHSEGMWERWDKAALAEKDAEKKARQAKKDYKDALREANLGF